MIAFPDTSAAGEHWATDKNMLRVPHIVLKACGLPGLSWSVQFSSTCKMNLHSIKFRDMDQTCPVWVKGCAINLGYQAFSCVATLTAIGNHHNRLQAMCRRFNSQPPFRENTHTQAAHKAVVHMLLYQINSLVLIALTGLQPCPAISQLLACVR